VTVQSQYLSWRFPITDIRNTGHIKSSGVEVNCEINERREAIRPVLIRGGKGRGREESCAFGIKPLTSFVFSF
jgi:hypothetical protein